MGWMSRFKTTRTSMRWIKMPCESKKNKTTFYKSLWTKKSKGVKKSKRIITFYKIVIFQSSILLTSLSQSTNKSSWKKIKNYLNKKYRPYKCKSLVINTFRRFKDCKRNLIRHSWTSRSSRSSWFQVIIKLMGPLEITIKLQLIIGIRLNSVNKSWVGHSKVS